MSLKLNDLLAEMIYGPTFITFSIWLLISLHFLLFLKYSCISIEQFHSFFAHFQLIVSEEM